MLREDIELVKVLARQIAKEEVDLAIKSLKKELEPPAQHINKPDVFNHKREVEEDAE